VTPLLVALGAAVGAPLRFLVARALDGRWPHGTLLVNLVGSFLLGALAGAAVSGGAMALLGTGFCGGLTTYSAFSVQSVDRWGRSRTLAAAYVVATIAGCLLCATLGHLAAGALS
jgi:CrcB protein